MKMEFRDGRLVDTDYWTADDGRLAGRTWLAVKGEVWHVLLPDTYTGSDVKMMIACPMTAGGEDGGWQWALVAGGAPINVRVPMDCICGDPPKLPAPGAWLQRRMLVYANHFFHLGPVKFNFGHFNHGEVPVSFGCELHVVRPRKVGDGVRLGGMTLSVEQLRRMMRKRL